MSTDTDIDPDCCIRHYVQWANGRPVTGGCSEGIDPEQQAEAARNDERAEAVETLIAAAGAARLERQAEISAAIVPAKPRGRRPGAFPRGSCPVCGRDTALRKNGSPFQHQRLMPGGYIGLDDCPGGKP